MYFSVLQHIFLLKNPGIDLYAGIAMNEASARRLEQITHFAFGPVGNVCDCGLDILQERARLATTIFQVTRNYEKWTKPFWTDNQNVEIFTRLCVREDVDELLGDRLPSETLQELKEVLFNIVYPTYARRGQRR